MPDEPVTVYEAVNQSVLVHVPKSTRRLLDIGCGSGIFGRKIKDQLHCYVAGVTHSKAEAELAKAWLDEVLVRDLNTLESIQPSCFDCIVCSHVLEHLYRPDQLLRRLHRELSATGVIVVALPNVLHWRQRLEFFRGRFKYAEGGLMDRTHYRFYDWSTAQDLLTQSGFSVLTAEADGSFPLSRFLPGLGKLLDRAALKLAPGLFGVQFVFVCRPRSN